ncbi:MAG TPA: NYN domain-containing protein [Baekduia sp.]|nr:NYN domain-containing protein [Baekduia sp.]
MRWLIDGMNVIGSRPDGWWRDRGGAMARLVEELDPWAAGEDAVAVVFDGRPRDAGAPGHVDVAFAPGGRDAADDEIARRVAADPDPASLTVVTSDRELVDRVRAAGAAVGSSKAFLTRLADYPRS